MTELFGRYVALQFEAVAVCSSQPGPPGGGRPPTSSHPSAGLGCATGRHCRERHGGEPAWVV